MSSKHRKNRPRHQPNRPTPFNTPRPGGGSPRKDASPTSPKRGAGLFLAGLAVVVVTGLIVYAATRGKQNPEPAGGPTSAPPPLLSVSATNPSPAPAPPPPRADGPRIQFATPVYDFGKATGDTLVNCVFTFTNTGNGMLEITEVSPGCGCMKAGEWSRRVEPGQTGSIPVRYDTRHYTGFFAKSVFVTCNDPIQPKPMLEIKGTVWRPLEITPPSAVLGLSAESPSNATSVRIISHLDEPLTLSDLQVTGGGFAVELQTNQPGKEYQVNVRTVPPWLTNSQQGQITLRTSTTNVPVINLNTFLNVQPVIIPIPYLVRLPALPLTNAFSGSVWVRNNGTNSLALSEPVVNANGVEVQIKEDQPGRLISLTLNFPAGFDALPGENLELKVKSNHPLFPIIRVPIVPAPKS